jgi:hypothetical protein
MVSIQTLREEGSSNVPSKKLNKKKAYPAAQQLVQTLLIISTRVINQRKNIFPTKRKVFNKRILTPMPSNSQQHLSQRRMISWRSCHLLEISTQLTLVEC